MTQMIKDIRAIETRHLIRNTRRLDNVVSEFFIPLSKTNQAPAFLPDDVRLMEHHDNRQLM